MWHWVCALPLILITMCFAAGSNEASAQEKRLALVIGNSDYKHAGELPNPRNDAADMATALEKLGFEVIKGVDLDKQSMEQTLRQFASALSDAELGLFFYAGHGLQVNGKNYLVPIDARLADAAALDFEVIRLELVQRIMERQGKTNILFLDACRNNPLARNLARAMGTRSASIGRGLAAAESGVGTLISFSTQPGNVALDGEGRNSPFAGALVEQLLTSRGDLSDILISVRNSVMRVTENRQIPWEHSALTSKIYFSPQSASAGEEVTQPSAQSQGLQIETAFWNAVRDSDQPAVIQSYLDRYPNGVFVPLAQLRLKQLAKASAKIASLSNPLSDSVDLDEQTLTQMLQQELQRVGCDPGSVDGHWGPKTQIALRAFAERTNIALHLEQPSQAALDAIKQHRVRVCPTKSMRTTSGAAARRNCRIETRAQCRARLGLNPYGRGGAGGQCKGTRTICD